MAVYSLAIFSFAVTFLLAQALRRRRIARALADLPCPHCTNAYGFSAACQSHGVILSVSREPGYRRRWGDSPDATRGITCDKCGGYAVFDVYGQRYEDME